MEESHLDAACRLLDAAGCGCEQRAWLDARKAADIRFADSPAAARAALASLPGAIDTVVQPLAARHKRLFISDMDSTIIGQECIDELAGMAGLKPQVAAITARAMAGELDFEQSLRQRVALLEGLDESAIARCLAERIRPAPGAHRLVATLNAHGLTTLLVSGGFHHFADVIGAELGFAGVYANRLTVEHGHLTGALDGPVVDAARKAEILAEEAARAGLSPAETLAAGDGANDIPMLRAAGLGIAAHAKPATRAAAHAAIDHGDLTAILYALGIPSADWHGPVR